MKIRFKAAFIAGILTMTMASAAQAEPCFEKVEVPPSLDCLGAVSDRGADFTGDCKQNSGTTVQVEVECPMRWYPKPQSAGVMSHGAFCSALGLRPASFGNAICASGERRPPSSQPGASSISYWGGTWGNTGTGGDHTSTNSFTSGGRDENRVTTTHLYCWTQGQKKDHDGSDMLVGYACQ